jgi:hypothetical protein
MSVEDEIKKAKEVYRKKKNPVLITSRQDQKQLSASPAPKPTNSIKDYLTVFFNIMKRDIIFRLGIQSDKDEQKETMREEYTDFMEAHFNGRC